MTIADSAVTRFLTTLRDGAGPIARFSGGNELCEASVRVLAAAEAAITLAMPDGRWEVLGVAGANAARFADAQAAVGEGPGPEALHAGVPVRLHSFADSLSAGRWPLLAQWDGTGPLGAMCSVPLRMGAIKVGFLDLLDADDIVTTRSGYQDAVQVANAITTLLLSTLPSANHGTEIDAAAAGQWWEQPVSTREIHQATGMVAVQLDCPAATAYARLVGHAFATGQALPEVAADVVARKLRFSPEPEADGRSSRGAAPDPVAGV
ncbi:ANTAR domain-containing protein [Nocardia sp. NPDC051030]|uniref:ANTAR domain-containing protein n=1 Tax=Nocardia sp. NPDC051030 TaxID=3155162 RepID=UPI00341CBD27